MLRNEAQLIARLDGNRQAEELSELPHVAPRCSIATKSISRRYPMAEKKILTALPKMAKAAQSEELQAAFMKHEGETEDQVERLEQVFEIINQPAKGKTCEAINGMVDEGQEVIKEFKGSAALDAGLLASAQAVEHYEISRYGTLKAWAEQLGLQEAVSLLDETLEEEKKTDEALTELAKAAVNP